MESFLIDEVEKLPYLWNPRHPHFTKRLKKIGFQQIAMRMSDRWPALEAFITPEARIEKNFDFDQSLDSEKKAVRGGDAPPFFGNFVPPV
ncbi:hypothetical protein TNCV_4779631 [Trichonephila clavipes]|nr:hypothetical protein TNCV_4779631 [Trichonephila clavipes]